MAERGYPNFQSKPELELANSQFPSAFPKHSEEHVSPAKVLDNNTKMSVTNRYRTNNNNESKHDQSMEDNFIPDIEGFYDRLINEAPYIPGDTMELIPASEIPWANLTLLKEGIKFGMLNFFSIVMANTAALMLGFSVKPDSTVLLRSGKFNTPEKSFLRYMSTGKRISTWYSTDISNVNSEGFKQIRAVRKLHTYYAKIARGKNPLPSLDKIGYTPDMMVLVNAIRKGLDKLHIPDAPTHLLTWDPPLAFSQFDVAMTQFGFVGLMYLFPEAFGIYKLQSMDSFLHFWAVVGRMLGLEDRFNLALHADKTLFKKLYYNIGMASVKSTDERVISLQYALITGLSRRLPLLTLKGWVYYALTKECVEFNGTGVWNTMGKKDKACYYCIKWTMVAIRKSTLVRIFLNFVAFLLFQLSFWVYLPKGCPMM